jgi:hypothetical protein
MLVEPTRGSPHLLGMTNRQQPSNTLDLFGHAPELIPPRRDASFTVQPTARRASQAKPSGPTTTRPTEMSDRDLAGLVSDALAELERRWRAGSRNRHEELSQAIEAIRAFLGRVDRKPSKAKSEPPPDLHETRKNAIRSALRAGVSAGQVAKHFGLPLATVRKIASRAG